MTDKDDVRREIDRAAKIVASWPKWKQGILKNSLKPCWDTPRQIHPSFNGQPRQTSSDTPGDE